MRDYKGFEVAVKYNHQTMTMFELLRSAVFDRSPILDSTVEIDWDYIMDVSSSQGILAWVYDGICKLPKESQPPRQQRINWALSAQDIWDRYAIQKEVLADMVKVCEKNDMRLLLLKGMSLSNLYPKPESRPSGDLDVYFFGDYEKGNRLFCESELIERKKEAEFQYKGVTIENHKTFVNLYSKHMNQVQKYLEESLSRSKKTEYGFYELPLIANLFFLVEHASNHLKYSEKCALPLRCIIDITMLLINNREIISPSECARIMYVFKMSFAFDLFLKIGEWALGVDMSDYRIQNIPNDDIEKAKQLFIEKAGTDVNTYRGLNTIGKMVLSYKLLNKNKWKYKYLPDPFVVKQILLDFFSQPYYYLKKKVRDYMHD